MWSHVIFAACCLAALASVRADKLPQQSASSEPHHVESFQHEPQQAQPSTFERQQQPHPSQQQFQQQQFQQQQFQQQQQQPFRPYPVRRQQSGMQRARSLIMDFMRRIMAAGSSLRRMANERFASVFNRRSYRTHQQPHSRPQQPFQRQDTQPVRHF